MAVEGIKISTSQVAATASQIRTLNTSLESRLSDIKAQMNGLTSTWQSDGCTAIQSKFNALEPKFAEYKQIVESYAKFLDNTAASYDATETAVESNANAFA